MAAFNQIQVGRFNRFLQKLLSMKGPASLESLGPELFPVLPIPSGNEDDYLRSFEHFFAGKQVPALAAKVQDFLLRNPAGSNVVGILHGLQFGNALSTAYVASISEGPQAADFANALGQSISLDARAGRRNSTLKASYQQINAVASNLNGSQGVLNVGGTAWNHYIDTRNQEIPILPGDAFLFSVGTVNIDAECTFFWRERFLEDSERT